MKIEGGMKTGKIASLECGSGHVGISFSGDVVGDIKIPVTHSLRRCFYFFSTAAFLTQTVQLDDSTVKFEIWVSTYC